MGLKITKIAYFVDEVLKGDNMSIEQIHESLEVELGANWWDSTDQYERA